MDFVELEAVEGLRWSWNSWPVSKAEVSSLVIPLSVMCTPLMKLNDLPLLSYEPLHCTHCIAVLNPYTRVDYTSRTWVCPFCSQMNTFPRYYEKLSDSNLPAELFPTYCAVEYQIGKPISNPSSNSDINSVSSLNFPMIRHWQNGLSPSSNSLSSMLSSSSLVSSFSSSSLSGMDSRGVGPAFVFVIDLCSSSEEMNALKNELLFVLSRLPDSALVGMITFDSMVRVHDLGFADCSRVVLIHGARKLSLEQTRQFLGIHGPKQQSKKATYLQNQGFILPISNCEFTIATAIEEICSCEVVDIGCRPARATGTAISIAVDLLEGCSLLTGSRIMVFTSGPATLGPGTIASRVQAEAIRTHRDLINGHASHYENACNFYKKLSKRLSDSSIVLDLFASSLDQVGASEIKVSVERSGGCIVMLESFESDRFRKSLREIFEQDEHGSSEMCFDCTIEVFTSKGVKVCSALGPCTSNDGNWKACVLTPKTCILFFFQVGNEEVHPGSPFLLQFVIQYRNPSLGTRKRVTTVARRWARKQSMEIATGFDQETAAAVMARIAIDRAENCIARDIIRWLDEKLIQFASTFGDYVPEDSSSFRLPSNFDLFPSFMYYLRRSQFLHVSNYSPDETAFHRMMLNRVGVEGCLVMIQPALFRYSFHGPPVRVSLDVRSISPDSILLFDSYFCVVVHYGTKVAQWRRVGYDGDVSGLSLRKVLDEVESHAQRLVAGRVPSPKIVKCDQHSSQARFLLAKLNPSVTHDSICTEGAGFVFTDDLSLQVFIEHLNTLAVQG